MTLAELLSAIEQRLNAAKQLRAEHNAKVGQRQDGPQFDPRAAQAEIALLNAAPTDLTTLIRICREQAEALAFYADPETYILRRVERNEWLERKPPQDEQMILDYAHPGTDWRGTVSVGGAKARECAARVEAIAREAK